jgi:hypothetical protein
VNRAERTDAAILASLRAVFTGPVEGRDYHVMPGRDAEERAALCALDVHNDLSDDALRELAVRCSHPAVTR